MKSKDFGTVETVLDLCKYCNGYHILILFLLVCGYSQVEVAQLLGVSRQALNDELILIRAQYIQGKRLTYRQAKEWNRKKPKHNSLTIS